MDRKIYVKKFSKQKFPTIEEIFSSYYPRIIREFDDYGE